MRGERARGIFERSRGLGLSVLRTKILRMTPCYTTRTLVSSGELLSSLLIRRVAKKKMIHVNKIKHNAVMRRLVSAYSKYGSKYRDARPLLSREYRSGEPTIAPSRRRFFSTVKRTACNTRTPSGSFVSATGLSLSRPEFPCDASPQFPPQTHSCRHFSS